MTFYQLLLKNDYTVYRLSKESGIAKTTLFDIVSGKTNILDCSGRTLRIIAKYLNVSIEDLLSLDHEERISTYENDVPGFLYTSLKNLKKGLREKSPYLDCFYDELNSSINVAEIENLITKEHAQYLRQKYL